MAGGLLEEGQARTYSPSPVNFSIQTSRLNVHTPSSDSMSMEESSATKVDLEQKASVLAKEENMAGKSPAMKKRMGLAILFLGILAEEG